MIRKYPKILYVICFFVNINNARAQINLICNLELGNGKATNNKYITSGATQNHQIIFDKNYRQEIGFRLTTNPQYTCAVGIQLPKMEFALGIEKGRTELHDIIFEKAQGKFIASMSTSANTNQWSLWFIKSLYARKSFNSNKGFYNCSLRAGFTAYYITHEFNDYTSGNRNFSYRDLTGVVTDSLIDVNTTYSKTGLGLSPKIYVGLSKSTWRLKPELVFSYHYSFRVLWQSERTLYYDYLSKSFTSKMQASGSQFKIAILIPLRLTTLK